MATPLSSSACASGRPGPPAYRRRRSQRFARKPQAATTITCYRRQCDGSAASERAQKIALAAALLAFSLAGCARNSSDSAQASNTDSQEKTEQAADATEGASAAPITADKVADGTYPITVDSSSNMFRIVDAQLIVENGSMHCVMTLSGTGYGKLFMGTGDEAAAASEADFIPYVENAEGKYTYDVPVDALDEDTACAAWSIRKEQWYDRTLVFESAGVDLRADALK